MPHKGNGLCATCYAVERGRNKRTYRRRTLYKQEWEQAHRAERLEYWRAYGARRRTAVAGSKRRRRRAQRKGVAAARAALLARATSGKGVEMLVPASAASAG
jgi:hypothetical protein